MSSVGLDSGPDMSQYVHPELKGCAELASKVVIDYLSWSISKVHSIQDLKKKSYCFAFVSRVWLSLAEQLSQL